MINTGLISVEESTHQKAQPNQTQKMQSSSGNTLVIQAKPPVSSVCTRQHRQTVSFGSDSEPKKGRKHFVVFLSVMLFWSEAVENVGLLRVFGFWSEDVGPCVVNWPELVERFLV